MQSFLIAKLVEVVLTLLSDKVMKQVVDAFLDLIEDAVENSENKVDDAVVLPICKRIRETFNVPDND